MVGVRAGSPAVLTLIYSHTKQNVRANTAKHHEASLLVNCQQVNVSMRFEKMRY